MSLESKRGGGHIYENVEGKKERERGGGGIKGSVTMGR